MTNDVIMDKVLADCSKPGVKVLEPPKLIAAMFSLLNAECLKPAKFNDRAYARLQTKTADVMGPLGALWSKLDEVRRGGEDEIDVADLLRLAEKSVMLLGQVFVYSTHQRRHGLLTRLLKDPSTAADILKEGEEELQEGLHQGSLFGEEFKKLLLLKAKGSKENKEIKQELGRPEVKPRPQASQPFQQGALRGGRGTARGFMARIRGRGATAAARGGRGSTHSRGYTYSRPGGDKARWVQAFFTSRCKVGVGEREPGSRRAGLPRMATREIGTGGPIRLGCVSPAESNTPSSAGPGVQERQRRQGLSGAKDCLVPGQLENYNSRPTGVKHSFRVEGDFFRDSSSVEGPTLAEVLRDRTEQATGGSSKDDGERSNKSGSAKEGPVPGPLVPQTEKRWDIQASVQPEKAECVREVRAFQDGGHVDGGRFTGEGRLDDKDRSQGCVLLCTNRRDAPEILPVQVEGRTVRISGSSVWSGISPQDVHKTPEAGYGPAEAHGAQGDYLSGRPVSLQPGEISPATGQRHSNLVVAVPGVCPQLGEIRTDADSDPGFSGVDGRFKKDVTLAPRKENGGDQGTLRSAVEQQGGDGERTSPASGEIDEHSEGSASSSAPLQTPSDGENKGAAKRRAELRDTGVDVGGGAGGAEMVDRVVQLGEWQTTDCPKPRPGNDHRCIRQRLGSSVPRRNYSRCMGQAGDKQTHKPPRIEGSEVCHYGLCEGSKGFTHSCEVRQQHDSGPDKQDGGHKVDRVAGRNQEAVVFWLTKGITVTAEHLPGSQNFIADRVLKSVPGLQQLETSDKGVPGVGDQMGPVRGGHVRRQAEQTEGDVLQLEARPTGSGDRCVHGALGQPEGVSVSAVLPNRQMSVENKEGRGQGGADSTDVASTTMVSTTPVNARRWPKIVAAHEGSAGVTVGNPSSAHGNKQPLAGGLESVWQRSRQQGLSEGAATLVSKAWRRGTACAYNAPWNKWVGWCGEREIDPFQATVGQVSNFLAERFEDGLEYATLNVYRSALSAFHPPIEGYKVGQHPVVSRLLHGAFNENPPRPRYTDTWEVNRVLEWMRGLGVNSEVPLKTLTWKLAMLLALMGACRGSELRSLKVSLMQDKGTEIWFRIDSLTKTKRPSNPYITLKWAQYEEDDMVDVTSCLRVYIERTRQRRGSGGFRGGGGGGGGRPPFRGITTPPPLRL